MLNKPEVFIGGAAECFASAGLLTHEGTRTLLAEQMPALRAWVLRTQLPAPAAVPA